MSASGATRTQLYSNDSTTCATGILDAWSQNDLNLLYSELDRAASLDAPPVMGADEHERIELLEGIASEMRGMVAGGRMEGASVYFDLLRHLAGTASR